MAFDQDGRLYVADFERRRPPLRRQGKYLGDLLVNSVSTTSPSRRDDLRLPGALLDQQSRHDAVVRYDRGVVVSLSARARRP